MTLAKFWPARFVAEGRKFPRFYGVAYRAYDRDGCVCYPVPLNWIVRWARHGWDWLVMPRRFSLREDRDACKATIEMMRLHEDSLNQQIEQTRDERDTYLMAARVYKQVWEERFAVEHWRGREPK